MPVHTALPILGRREFTILRILSNHKITCRLVRCLLVLFVVFLEIAGYVIIVIDSRSFVCGDVAQGESA